MKMNRIAFFLIAVVLPILSILAESAGAAESPGNFQRFFIAGGPLVWFLLLPLSALTIQLIVRDCLIIRRGSIIPAGLIDGLLPLMQASRSDAAKEYLEERDGFLARVLQVGLAQTSHGLAAMENAVAEMLEQETTQLLRRIEWLSIIGSVAPMIGLFGTVWGMINAFTGIVQAGGQPEPADLAGGISTALVTTWWGLVVAIPALAAYGYLRNRIDVLTAEAAVSAEETLRNIKTP